MTDVRAATAEFLEEYPDLEDRLRTLLDIDENGTWGFDDVPFDSGQFGEIVSRGIVEAHDGEYHIANRDAVRAALEKEHAEDTESSIALPELELPEVDRTAALSVAGALVFVALVRVVFMYGAVFRNGDIVLAGNDPYFYRYWGEELLRRSLSAFDLQALSNLPGRLPNHDVLMIVAVWWTAAALGGTKAAVGQILAWYPVLAGVLSAICVYLVAVRLTDDRRVGLGAVLLLGITPAHAYRTALGFGDHHAFDYVWLALTGYALVVIATEHVRSDDQLDVSRTGLLAAGTLGIGVAAQTTAWRGGPLLMLPIAIYASFRSYLDVRAGRSPLRANSTLLIGLGIGSVLGFLPHVAFGWLETYRWLAPGLLFTGTVGVLVIGETVRRLGLPAKAVLYGEAIVGLVGGSIVWITLPDVAASVVAFYQYLLHYGASNIAETRSMFSGGLGSIFAPVLFFGFVLFLAVPYMTWGAYRAYEGSNEWLAATAYVWFFFVLSIIQIRFTGQLAMFAAPFAGLGFVHLAAKVDVARSPVVFETNKSSTPQRNERDTARSFTLPSRQQGTSLLLLFLLVGSAGAVQTPIKMSQIAIDDSTYQTATWIDGYAERQGIEYPQNYVLSQWSHNRVYNYFVSGQSRSYSYAQSNYGDFLTSTQPEQWYERLSQKPTGFVVVRSRSGNFSDASVQSRLWNRWGGRGSGVAGVGHYRAIYADDTQKVYELVPGAILVGRATPGESSVVNTKVDAGSGSHTYEREVTATANGWYAVRVPYSGSYQVPGGTQHVSESAVRGGGFTSEVGREARWPLDASRGDVAFDTVGGHHGYINGAMWQELNGSTVLSFDGNDSVTVPQATTLSGDNHFAVSVTFRTKTGTDYGNDVKFPRLVGTAPAAAFRNSSGYQIALARGRLFATIGNGDTTVRLEGPRVDDDRWHTATLVRNGSTVRLLLDGETVQEQRYSGTVPNHTRFAIGSTTDGRAGYVGDIRNATFHDLPDSA